MPVEYQFFGRKPIMDTLKRRLLDLKEGYRQNVALLGYRFVGKTAIIDQLLHEMEGEDLIFISFDFDQKDIHCAFSKYIRSLLINFSRHKNLPLFDDVTILIENCRSFIPLTIDAIKSIQSLLLKDKLDDAYRQLMSIPDIFTVESGKFCVIALEEFQDLEAIDACDVYQELGKKIMTQKKCLYIVTSSMPHLAKKILAEKLSLLFGNFEVIEVEPFDLKTSQQFIDQRLFNLNINAQSRDFLADFTGGHPLYLSLLIQQLINLAIIHQQKDLYLPIVLQAIENALFDRWGVLSRHCEILAKDLCFGKNSPGMASLLIALANGKYKLTDLSESLGLKTSLLNSRISRLLEAGIISRYGAIFHFQDKLFKYWLQYVFQKRVHSVDSFSEKQREAFRLELERSISNFTKISQKDLPLRIVELLSCFDNEAFNLNGRKYKLPAFREVVLIQDLNSDGKIIKADAPEGTWFIVCKSGSLCENDINLFLTETKKIEEKPQRRIVVSLQSLDENARVKALQERMWIWNEKELNALLSFYDKPFLLK